MVEHANQGSKSPEFWPLLLGLTGNLASSQFSSPSFDHEVLKRLK